MQKIAARHAVLQAARHNIINIVVWYDYIISPRLLSTIRYAFAATFRRIKSCDNEFFVYGGSITWQKYNCVKIAAGKSTV